MKTHILLLLIFAIFIQNGQTAKILASVYSPSLSHQLAFRPIWHELASRGHDITLITTDPEENAPYKQIDTSYSYKIMEELGLGSIVSQQNSSKTSSFNTYINGLHKVSDYQFGTPEVEFLINNEKEKFDLLMLEVIYPGHMAFVDRFKAPFIGLVSLDAPPVIHRAVGNPTNPILYPDTVMPFTSNLTFKQRVVSFLANIGFYVFSTYFFYPNEDANVAKHFEGYTIRPLNDIQHDMDMLFINVNPVFHKLRPLGPNTIQIGGGTHLKEAKPLPKELEEYLNGSKNGVVYFSLGTNVKSNLLTDDLKETIIKTLGELPYDILWKYDEDITGLPKNIKVSKWIPQQDLFRHPQVKLFITQCGLQSVEEAILMNVPIVGMPFFGDQHKNAQIVLEKEIGLVVDRTNVKKEEFKEKIIKVIEDPKFKNNMKMIAKLMTDVEMTGLEKAVWWTEYVIRHKGAKHFKSYGTTDPFYTYFMLDVVCFVLLVLFIVFYVNWRILNFFVWLVFGRKKADVKKKTN
ncbi:unnamed protein product [Brassicogethes aeneus]|uniref:UDP-glucuronosyltransferase n=1 Tax=Brassicogethes aeneus TaxID=1431903 RepID=A0A9P0ASN7_BRAAE|nr:unnamed protein product [Brassicogethes aeneus]